MTTNERIRMADWLAWGAVFLAAIASVAGLAVPGLYRDREAFVRLTQADDVMRVVLVLPLLAVNLWRTAAGSVIGRLVALGALATLAYSYAFLAFGAALSAVTLVHIGILGLVFWSLLLSSTALDRQSVEGVVLARIFRRSTGVFLLATALLSVGQWSGTIAVAVSSGTQPADVARLGLTTNPLYAIELAFAVPLMAVAGIGLLRRRSGAAPLAVPLLVFLTLLGLGLAWEAVFVALRGGALDSGMAVAGVVFLAVPAILLAPVLLNRSRGPLLGIGES